MTSGDEPWVSAAFFCPQTTAADAEYLDTLHIFLSQNSYGRELLSKVAVLANQRLWEIFAIARKDVRALSYGPAHLEALREWANSGVSKDLAAIRSNIIMLPLLAIIQMGQYLRYLEFHGLKHRDFLLQIQERGGGIHGYCGGLPAAMSIACAEDEAELIRYIVAAIRVTIGIGAYTEAGDDGKGAERTLLAVRLRHENQGAELTRRFPGTYISAITSPRSISIGGPPDIVKELFSYAMEQEGLRVQMVDLGGSAHNPANVELAAELCRLCRDAPDSELQLPDASRLKVPLRSNQTGERIPSGSLTDDLITTNLAACCEWFKLLTGVAQDLASSTQSSHEFVIFGSTDCVTTSPFYQLHLQIKKTMAKDLLGQGLPMRDSRGKPNDSEKEREKYTREMQENPYLSSGYTFPDNAIAVVGASCRLPGANNMEELWDMLARGKSQVQELSPDRFDLFHNWRSARSGSLTKQRKFYGNFIDDVKRFDHSFFGISSREAANMDPQQRLALELSFEALEDAGYLVSHERTSNENVGCFVGLVLAEYMENTNGHSPTAYTSTGTVPAFVCGRISHTYGWSGPSEMFNTACSSSMVAINRACKAIQAGECDMALAGGVNVISGVNNYLDLAKAGFLSPTGQCKPFDASADGYCRADGAGFVMLKRLDRAVVDGDRIWGVIAGVGTNQAGLSSSITTPDPSAQQALYRKVLSQANIQPEQITYVEAHGTGTQVGDPLEIESVRSVFGRKKTPGQQGAYVGSIKANVGHSEPAAGVAGLLKVLAMLRKGQIPPQAGFRQINPKITLTDDTAISIPTNLVGWNSSFRAALVNSYGAAGSNGALVCCDMPATGFEQSNKYRHDLSLPLLITAKSKASLVEYSKVLSAYLDGRTGDARTSLSAIAYTLNQRRQRHRYVASVSASSIREAAKALSSLSQGDILETSTTDPGTKPAIVLAFSGQHSKSIALPKDILESFPIFQHYLESADSEFQKLGYVSLLPTLLQGAEIDDVVLLQCSLFAVQYATARCWIDAGVQPRAIIGHSLGELTALAVSGVLSLADTIKLIASRAELIKSQWDPERGAMLAIECDGETWSAISSAMVKEHGNSFLLDVACYNGPASIVVSGKSEAVEAAETMLRTNPRFQNLRFQHVQTSHGFHSALTKPILSGLALIGQSLTWNEPRIPLFTCTENMEPGSQDIVRHMRQSVFFANAVRRTEETIGSSCLWLEAGFNTPIIAMAKRACKHPDKHNFQAMKTHHRVEPVNVVTEVVKNLWQSRVFLTHWTFLSSPGLPNNIRPYSSVWLPPYCFAKTQHWVDHVDRATELEQEVIRLEKMSKSALGSSHFTPNPPENPPLVRRLENQEPSRQHAKFVIETKSARFQSVVSGHVVCSRPLCPAPLYIESATMGLFLLLEGDKTCPRDPHQIMDDRTLVVSELRVSQPLSLEPNGDMVLLYLDEVPGAQQTWKFTILSSIAGEAGSIPSPKMVHTTGIISLTKDAMLDGYQRLVSTSIRHFSESSGKDILQSARAYSLFSRVVKYEQCFKGMQSVELNHNEALARIKVPSEQPHREDSNAWKVCDAITIDACVHVVGLLINTSELLGSDEVAVMVGLDRVVVSPSFVMEGSTVWQVFANFTDHQQQLVGDVYVRSPEGSLVAVFLGCCMTRLPKTRLERVLDAAFSSSSSTALPPQVHSRPAVAPAPSATTTKPTLSEKRGLPDPSSTIPRTPDRSLEKIRLTLRELISECTGVDRSEIPDHDSLGHMGLDSLGAAELSEELSSKLGLTLASMELIDLSPADIDRLLGSRSPDSNIETDHDDVETPTIHHVPAPAPSSDFLMSSNQSNSDAGGHESFFNIVAETLGVPREDLKSDTCLDELGIDSLSIIDLGQEIEDRYSISLNLMADSTIEEIMTRLGLTSSKLSGPSSSRSDQSSVEAQITTPGSEASPISAPVVNSLILSNPFEALRALDERFESFAAKHGISGYWEKVAPFQDELTCAYIVEGFAGVGVDLRLFSPGQSVPLIKYVTPKYDKLVRRLWEILEKREIISITSRNSSDMPLTISRGSKATPSSTAAKLLHEFDVRFPSFSNETKLIGMTGPRLAECLSGKVDSVAVMFGSAASLKVMEDYYGSSPISSTLTDQLGQYLTGLFSQSSGRVRRKVRILEAGGGTGGTTRWLAKALSQRGIDTEYTFTDISPSLVKKAKSRFEPQYPWMKFTPFNLESDLREDFRGQFDIVLATNTVHATTDRIKSVQRMREALVPAGGLVVLAELTSHIDWCDICFGLLDGWWLADGPIAPLQTAPEWMETFASAGFRSMGFSTGPSREAKTAQLLVASNMNWPVETATVSQHLKERGHRLQTIVYKEIDDVKIEADVYYPKIIPQSPMPIALMIHGGGHMLLSRRAVRPAQTRWLLSQGLLPVSIDYRLCPEVNLIDGPITDVCDAYRWVQTVLPSIAAVDQDLKLDPSRVVVVGWSTGGHLAMSLGWTAEAAGLSPPKAVLSFYAPVDFESGELDSERFLFLPKPKMSLEDILSSLPQKPITNTVSTSATSELGWVQGEPRSELLLTLSQRGIALPVLLNGLNSAGHLNLTPPSPSTIAAISPLARLRAGDYTVPTCIIHGSEDEVAPYPAAERFIEEMERRGRANAFVSLSGRRHLFDLGLEEGSPNWNTMVVPGMQFLLDHI